MIESEGMGKYQMKQGKPATAKTPQRTLDSTNEVETIYETRTLEQESEAGAKEDWRQYFTIEELTAAFEKIQNGEDPNDDEIQDEDGSDSAPSEGNLDLQELYGVIYCEGKKKNEKLAALNEAE